MSRLLNRMQQIPGGLRYYQPESKWRSAPWASFDTIVNALIQHRKGNPALTQKHGWAVDYETVANEVDHYNASLCQQMGWMKYVAQTGGPDVVPKSIPLHQTDPKHLSAVADKVKKIWAGVKTTNDWLDSGEPPVSREKAYERAGKCVGCVNNGAGDFTKWFTLPAAESIKRQLEKAQALELATPLDDQLNICEACLCPLKLKVHTPMKYIAPHMTEPTKQELGKNPDCWILKELHEQ